MTARETLAARLAKMAPMMPRHERLAVLDHVEGSPGLGRLAPGAALRLAMIAYARHALTDYEAMLSEGYAPEAARHFCRDAIEGILKDWGARPLAPEEGGKGRRLKPPGRRPPGP